MTLTILVSLSLLAIGTAATKQAGGSLSDRIAQMPRASEKSTRLVTGRSASGKRLRAESDPLAYWHSLAVKRLHLLGKRERRIVHLLGVVHKLRGSNHGRTRPRALSVPHYKQWLCIHSHEGSWTDAGDPYWGGLQMDRSFMSTYAPRWLLAKGWANAWTPLEQMWVAERAWRTRGFSPWPNTARYCGLL